MWGSQARVSSSLEEFRDERTALDASVRRHVGEDARQRPDAERRVIRIVT